MKIKITTLALFSLLFTSMVFSKSPSDFMIMEAEDEVEVKLNGNIEYMDNKVLGTLPIKILATDNQDFYKIKTKNNKIIWVSASFVTTNEETDMYGKIVCESITVSQKSDRKQFAARGINNECN